MAVNGVYDSAGYNFGSLASIRKQTEAIRQRAIAQREARIAEQDETGLIQNPDTGEMVELSSISEETREKWNNRLDMRNISPGEAMIMFKATDPNAETVEKSKELGKRYEKLQNKLLSSAFCQVGFSNNYKIKAQRIIRCALMNGWLNELYLQMRHFHANTSFVKLNLQIYVDCYMSTMQFRQYPEVASDRILYM